jgi:hypothetical protein
MGFLKAYSKVLNINIKRMGKNLFYLVLFIVIASYSCKDDYEKANENIKGVWALESMQYQDSTGMIKVVPGSGITLTFLDDKASTSADDSGYQIVRGDTMFFQYYIAPDVCNFSFDEAYDDTDKGYYKTWPLDAIGRANMYYFNKIDKKTIELAYDWEPVYLTNQKLINVSYVYTKVSDLAE